MLSSDFEFYAPSDLSEALALLKQHGEGTKVIAGGMSMMPAMNLGILRPSTVVSFNHVSGLDYIEDEADALRIGCMVRHERIRTDEQVARHAPMLREAASVIGDAQIRHRGTIGGSVVHADPSADYLPVLVASDAELKLGSADGERTIKARDFFVDVMMTALEPAEVLLEIRVQKQAAGAGSAYLRLARVEGSFAIVNAAAIVNDGQAVVAVGGAAPTPALVDLSLDLSGEVSDATLDQVGDAAHAACEDAYGDLSGSPDYRRAMARVYAKRAVKQALAAKAA